MIYRLRRSLSWWHRVAPPIPWRKRVGGVMLHGNLRDHMIYWTGLEHDLLDIEPVTHSILSIGKRPDCASKYRVWDVGCNIGVFTLDAMRHGWDVVAFDIAPKSVYYCMKNAAKLIADRPDKMLNMPVVYATALTAGTRKWLKWPRGSWPGTKVEWARGWAEYAVCSLTYLEVAAKHGVPHVIKMDIEGAESEFLEDEKFMAWVRSNDIEFIVERHGVDGEPARVSRDGDAPVLAGDLDDRGIH